MELIVLLQVGLEGSQQDYFDCCNKGYWVTDH